MEFREPNDPVGRGNIGNFKDTRIYRPHHEDRTPTHGYEPTRETAMAAFAKSWRRDS
jgi:hypothetical protein